MKFVQIALWPSRFVDNPEAQEGMREAVNRQLAFRGLYLRPDGKFEAVTPAETVNEARAHANRLREELERIQEAEVLR